MRLLTTVLAVTAVVVAQHVPYALPGNDVAGTAAVFLGAIGGGVIGLLAVE